MHRLLTLDLSDPLVPVEIAGVSLATLPLYYPLRYGMGGGEAQYRPLADEEIELFYICAGEPDEEYPFMDEFPQRPLGLEPFTYEQFRAFLMSEQGEGFDTSSEDAALVKSFDYSRLIQIGGRVLPMQGDLWWRCRNPACKWSNVDASLHVFARVSATPFEDVSIFGEYGTDVEIYFALCRACGSIVTVNRCT